MTHFELPLRLCQKSVDCVLYESVSELSSAPLISVSALLPTAHCLHETVQSSEQLASLLLGLGATSVNQLLISFTPLPPVVVFLLILGALYI